MEDTILGGCVITCVIGTGGRGDTVTEDPNGVKGTTCALVVTIGVATDAMTAVATDGDGTDDTTDDANRGVICISVRDGDDSCLGVLCIDDGTVPGIGEKSQVRPSEAHRLDIRCRPTCDPCDEAAVAGRLTEPPWDITGNMWCVRAS